MARELSQAALARALGLSGASITKLKGQGMPVHSVEAARAWRTKHLNVAKRNAWRNAGRTMNGHGNSSPSSGIVVRDEKFQSARTSREEAAAQREHIELLKERDVLVRRDKVRSEIARRLAGLRDSLLQIPSRLQSVLAAESDEAKCHDILQDELYLVLAQITEVA